MARAAAVSSETGKSLRVDAERRRQALLCAAASVFLQEGIDAPLENVAREAGVGIATLYRRFPTRDALVEAVFDVKMETHADRAEELAERADTDPRGALADHVRGIVEMQVADPAFGEAMMRPHQGSDLFADSHTRAMRAARRIILRARRAGVVRQDLRDADLYLVVVAAAAVVRGPGPIEPARAARRLVELFLDAFELPGA